MELTSPAAVRISANSEVQVQSEPDTARVIWIDRFGGLLHEYARAA
jgi:hypothetical protein